jgi:hypothetical protein
MTRATSRPVEELLGRLERVRPCGKGWVARCPAHEDRTASLSVACGDDGRVLLHCFAGCASTAVLGALGLELRDLFDRPISDPSPEARRALREHAIAADMRAAVAAIGFEALVLRVAAEQVRQGVDLGDSDAARLDQALDRIEAARLALAPGRRASLEGRR